MMRRAEWREAQSQAALARWRRHADLSPAATAMVHGLVASDASLCGTVPKGGQAHLTITSKHHSFAEHVADGLRESGLDVRVRRLAVGNRCYWNARTLSYDALGDVWREWYPRGRKALLDFPLSPRALLYWYMGDGTLKRRTNPRSVSVSAQFGTYAFDRDSLLGLAERMVAALSCEPRGVRVYVCKAGPIVSLTNAATRRFLDYIGPSPLSEFDCKWNLAGPGE